MLGIHFKQNVPDLFSPSEYKLTTNSTNETKCEIIIARCNAVLTGGPGSPGMPGPPLFPGFPEIPGGPAGPGMPDGPDAPGGPLSPGAPRSPG